MMGRRERGQSQFFYAFDLDKAVPADHLVRQIDGVLDLDWVHKELRLTTRTLVGLQVHYLPAGRRRAG